MDRKDAWLMWVVYRAKINTNEFTFVDGVTDAKFTDIQDIVSSENMFEQAIVEVGRVLQTQA